AAARLGRRSVRGATLDDLAALDDELLPRARHVVTESGRGRETVALLDAGRSTEIGPLLHASHASLAGHYARSCPELHRACATARAAGAVGARMTGGGFGGAAIALVSHDHAEGVEGAVRATFAAGGHREPEIRATEPSAGAERVS